MKLAAVQYRPPKGDLAEARRGLCALVDRAGAEGADLVVCPEMATTGYVWDSAAEIAPHCEPARGPTFSALSEIAARRGCWVVTGFAERGEDGLYNSALIIDDRGALRGCYRKVLLYVADTTWAREGYSRPIYRAPFGTVTPCICMDLNDYRFNWHLQLRRPEILAFCTNWIDEGEEILDYWRDRMTGWRGWFVAADTWGEDRGTTFYGRSTILDPDGAVRAMAEREGDEVLIVDAG